MRNRRNNGILVDGSIRSAGVTFYTKKGQTIVRSSKSNERRSQTRKQFVVRQKRMLCNLFWNVLKGPCRQLHLMGDDPYRTFCALAAKLPAVFLTREEFLNGHTLLLPGIPVSCGTLPDIALTLGTVDGVPALLTDLTPAALDSDGLTLVELRQQLLGGAPYMSVDMRRVTVDEFVIEAGKMALVGDDYGDPMRGWALVRQRGPLGSHGNAKRSTLCSTQRVVTDCRLYLPYLTDEALLRAASSFGGLTSSP